MMVFTMIVLIYGGFEMLTLTASNVFDGLYVYGEDLVWFFNPMYLMTAYEFKSHWMLHFISNSVHNQFVITIKSLH